RWVVESRHSPAASAPSPPNGGSELNLSFDFLNPALHVEVAFRHGVVFAVENLLEAAHRFGHRDLFSLVAAKHGRHREGLAQETLNLAGAQHRNLVIR